MYGCLHSSCPSSQGELWDLSKNNILSNIHAAFLCCTKKQTNKTAPCSSLKFAQCLSHFRPFFVCLENTHLFLIPLPLTSSRKHDRTFFHDKYMCGRCDGGKLQYHLHLPTKTRKPISLLSHFLTLSLCFCILTLTLFCSLSHFFFFISHLLSYSPKGAFAHLSKHVNCCRIQPTHTNAHLL